MGSNFKKSWSFWGGRKRFDHKFTNSFDEYEGPRVRLEDRFQNSGYERNQFQTRSLRYDRRNLIQPNNYQNCNTSMNNELDQRKAHSQWSKNIQKSLGFQNLVSPHHNKFRSGPPPQTGQEPRQPLLNTPNTPKMYHRDQDVTDRCPEPIYENIQSLRSGRVPLLQTPMDSPGVQPLHFPEEEMEMTPDLPPRNPVSMRETEQNGGQLPHRGGARINKAFQGVCTSMRTFSQRFRKKTKRHYQLDSSPATPRMTPGKNLYPFDLNTPMTPHSYKRGTKRLQSSARRSLAGKENYGISRTPSHFHNTRANWANFSPMQIPDGRYRPN